MEYIYPFVTAMIVVRNEENYIASSIQSLLNQDYPKDWMELLIIDGMSEDKTRKVASDIIAEWERLGNHIAVRYLENPKKNLAAGWNIGIQAARGEYTVRIDAHAQADSQMIRKCVEILQTHDDVACAGGRIEASPLTEGGRIISYVMSSPFGVGNAKFRYAAKSGYVDTVAYGVYRKSIFQTTGLFNESFQRNQDNDMHGRIKACGGKFYLDVSIVSLYHPRETVKGMMKQGFGNGKWVVVGWRRSERRDGISLRHLIPLLFLLANVFLIIGGLFLSLFRLGLLAMYIVYIALSIYFGLQKTKRLVELVQWGLYCWLFHMSYGAGSLTELLRLRN